MTNRLESLADRLVDDSAFLACPLHVYAQTRELDAAGLGSFLACTPEDLVRLRLCRTPREDAASFRKDLEHIAVRIRVDEDRLAEAVRCGQSILKMRPATGGAGTLWAARDADETGGDS